MFFLERLTQISNKILKINKKFEKVSIILFNFEVQGRQHIVVLCFSKNKKTYCLESSCYFKHSQQKA